MSTRSTSLSPYGELEGRLFDAVGAAGFEAFKGATLAKLEGKPRLSKMAKLDTAIRKVLNDPAALDQLRAVGVSASGPPSPPTLSPLVSSSASPVSMGDYDDEPYLALEDVVGKGVAAEPPVYPESEYSGYGASFGRRRAEIRGYEDAYKGLPESGVRSALEPSLTHLKRRADLVSGYGDATKHLYSKLQNKSIKHSNVAMSKLGDLAAGLSAGAAEQAVEQHIDAAGISLGEDDEQAFLRGVNAAAAQARENVVALVQSGTKDFGLKLPLDEAAFNASPSVRRLSTAQGTVSYPFVRLSKSGTHPTQLTFASTAGGKRRFVVFASPKHVKLVGGRAPDAAAFAVANKILGLTLESNPPNRRKLVRILKVLYAAYALDQVKSKMGTVSYAQGLGAKYGAENLGNLLTAAGDLTAGARAAKYGRQVFGSAYVGKPSKDSRGQLSCADHYYSDAFLNGGNLGAKFSKRTKTHARPDLWATPSYVQCKSGRFENATLSKNKAFKKFATKAGILAELEDPETTRGQLQELQLRVYGADERRRDMLRRLSADGKLHRRGGASVVAAAQRDGEELVAPAPRGERGPRPSRAHAPVAGSWQTAAAAGGRSYGSADYYQPW